MITLSNRELQAIKQWASIRWRVVDRMRIVDVQRGGRDRFVYEAEVLKVYVPEESLCIKRSV